MWFLLRRAPCAQLAEEQAGEKCVRACAPLRAKKSRRAIHNVLSLHTSLLISSLP